MNKPLETSSAVDRDSGGERRASGEGSNRPGQRQCQFTLRSLLVLTTVLAVVCAFVVNMTEDRWGKFVACLAILGAAYGLFVVAAVAALLVRQAVRSIARSKRLKEKGSRLE